MGKLSWFALGVIAGLSAAAVDQQLRQPPEQRTWKGTVAGVPYNFNVPEWRDIAAEYWNPESDEILTPHAVGIGWGVNAAALTRRVQDLVAAQQQRGLPPADQQ